MPPGTGSGSGESNKWQIGAWDYLLFPGRWRPDTVQENLDERGHHLFVRRPLRNKAEHLAYLGVMMGHTENGRKDVERPQAEQCTLSLPAHDVVIKQLDQQK